MRTTTIAAEVIDVPLSPAAVSAALWARDAARRTFELSVAMGYLQAMPELPAVANRRMRIACDALVWEEFDYQLTIGLSELEFPEEHGVNLEAGRKLARQLRLARQQQGCDRLAIAG